MMIEAQHAIIADVAVSRALGPEDQARLAELEAVELSILGTRSEVGHVQVENALRLSQDGAVTGVDPALGFRVEDLKRGWILMSGLALLTLEGMIPGSMVAVQSMRIEDMI